MAETRPFGRCPLGQVETLTIRNHAGMQATILTLGATVQSVCVPCGGELVDVVLGYDDAALYWTQPGYLGACVGRNANRIAGAAFTLNGVEYRLSANENGNQLHGGTQGFDHRLWEVAEQTDDSVTLTYEAQDGEEGFPGRLACSVTYRVEEDNALSITYNALPDADTIVNFTNHSYFNLNGGGDILSTHALQLSARAYTPCGEGLIPTGEVRPVEHTPMDFRTEKLLGQDFAAVGLYDINFCLDGAGLRKVGTLRGSRLSMEILTDCPGLQIYCARYDTPKPGKHGTSYLGSCFCCLETQAWPDAVHHADFPQTVVRAGEPYHSETVYRFR